MDPAQVFAPEDASPLGRSRADVLDMLRAADGPLGVREVAQRMGLHQNTARFHLEALVEAGLAVREAEDRETPGRPRIGYRPTAHGPAGRRRYRLLAEMLTGMIAATVPDPGRAAAEAGREWGSYLAEQPPPYQRPSAPEALAKLSAIMEELGFAPQAEAGDGDGEYRLNLRQCPFREVAQQHKEVICALHLGLMRGALAQMRAPVSAERLEPFTEPSLCIARLTASPEARALFLSLRPRLAAWAMTLADDGAALRAHQVRPADRVPALFIARVLGGGGLLLPARNLRLHRDRLSSCVMDAACGGASGLPAAARPGRRPG